MSDREVWNAYWADKKGDCLPAAPAIKHLLDNFWRDIAGLLAEGATSLDIATGGGAVPRAMRAERDDIVLWGCDVADRLPEIPVLDRLETGIDLADLPFEDKSVAMTTSQFGLEYGDVEAGLAEIGRVVAGKGFVALITHREDSPVLAHNMPRAEQLEWVLDDDGIAAATRRYLDGDKDRPAVAAAAADRFGKDGVAYEFAQGLDVVMQRYSDGDAARSIEALEQMVGEARHEVGRIDSLRRAAANADEKAISEGLQRQGFEAPQRAAFAAAKGEAPYANAFVTRRGF